MISLTQIGRLGIAPLALALAGCGSEPEGSGGIGSGPKGGNDGTGGAGASAGSGGSGGLIGPGPGQGGAAGTPDIPDGEVCAGETHAAEPMPVDIYVMFDQSVSMTERLPNGATRWDAVVGALQTFLASPASDGLGVGIQYFGRGGDVCDPANYSTPDVPITTLPAAAPAILGSLATHGPSNLTPTGPAYQGALEYAKQWAADHPTRTTAVVLMTDGYPTECEPRALSHLKAAAAAALTDGPRVLTFVVGLGSVPNLNGLAEAGGTGEAFLIDDGAEVGQRFADAMASIASTPLACEYEIPLPLDPNEKLDFDKVNVRYTPSAGAEKTFERVDTPGDCIGGGWHYDQPVQPTSILLCPETCAQLGAGAVDVLLGCDTRTVPR